MALVVDHERARSPRRTTILSIAAAAVLVALKLGVGIATASLGLVSAGIESSGDVIAALITFFAVRLGGRPADRGHPYGHRRAENLSALGEAAILLAGGIVVSVQAIKHLALGGRTPQVRWYEFAVLALALVLDGSRLRASRRAARRFKSPALRSNAWHFANDMAGTIVVAIGLALVYAGAHGADSVAALVVAAIILAASLRLMSENANALMDRAPAQARAAAERALLSLGEDVDLGRLRLRESAGRYFADVVVRVPPGQAVVEGHRAADLIEGALERALPGSDVVVHVEPRLRGLDLREAALAIALAEPLVKEAHDIAIFEGVDGGTSVSLHLKFPAEAQLSEAHEVAERVERAIAARPGVGEVQTHLEPLERPLSARPYHELDEHALRGDVAALVRALTGHDPRMVRLLSTDAGRVLFITVGVGDEKSLSAAHLLAGELEDRLRRRIAGIAEVVVHTEP
jgi:cation diffusion facilitator family transporter